MQRYIRVSWGHIEPPFFFFFGGGGGRGGRRGSATAPLERAMVVSCRLSIVTIALSVTILNVSDAQISRGGSLWAQIWGVPLGVDP